MLEFLFSKSCPINKPFMEEVIIVSTYVNTGRSIIPMDRQTKAKQNKSIFTVKFIVQIPTETSILFMPSIFHFLPLNNLLMVEMSS